MRCSINGNSYPWIRAKDCAAFEQAVVKGENAHRTDVGRHEGILPFGEFGSTTSGIPGQCVEVVHPEREARLPCHDQCGGACSKTTGQWRRF